MSQTYLMLRHGTLPDGGVDVDVAGGDGRIVGVGPALPGEALLAPSMAAAMSSAAILSSSRTIRPPPTAAARRGKETHAAHAF